MDTNEYILVKLTHNNNVVDAVEICKAIEAKYEGARAMTMRRGSDHIPTYGWQGYVGEFYSTPQAIERVMA